MSIRSKLNVEKKGMLTTLIFYAATGIIFLLLLPLTGFPPHMGIIGIFSLIAAYGLFQKRSWTIWLIGILFFVGTTFSITMLSYYLFKDYLLGTSVVAYLVLIWIFTTYAVWKRKTLES